MTPLPVSAIFAGLQSDGHWSGTPAVIIQLMEHPLAALPAPESLDGSYPLPEWDFNPANEVALNKLLGQRPASSPQFAYVGPSSLAALACTYRERHVLIIGREPGRHNVAALIRPLLTAGRTVQVETTMLTPSMVIENLWISLLDLPSRSAANDSFSPENADRPDEILACIRWRSDLDRTEQRFANRKIPVWLRPSTYAEAGIRRQCVAVATRHAGWRVTRAARLVETGV
jgi:hypothetical protein